MKDSITVDSTVWRMLQRSLPSPSAARFKSHVRTGLAMGYADEAVYARFGRWGDVAYCQRLSHEVEATILLSPGRRVASLSGFGNSEPARNYLGAIRVPGTETRLRGGAIGRGVQQCREM